jgi:type IV conjugative transfer system protein TraL
MRLFAMSGYKAYTFKTLDHPSRILFWKLDEFFVMIVPIFLSLALGSLFMAFGVFLKIPYKKLKKKFSHCSLMHHLYWYLPTKRLSHLKRLPPSHQRELVL